MGKGIVGSIVCRFAAGALVFGAAPPALADSPAPLAAEGFAIGSAGAVCEAQGVRLGAARGTVFDRKWALICRDVGRPVGQAYSWRSAGGALQRVAQDRSEPLACDEAAAPVEGLLPGATVRACRGERGVGWLSYTVPSNGRTVVVEGLAAYDSALRLALASIAADRVVPGTVELVSTGGAGSLAQARAALGDADLLIGQGYRRNNSGDFSEAEEFFRPDLVGGQASLVESRHEAMVNRALQLSNLGRFEEAGRVFGEARAIGLRDPIQLRLLRNFEAIDAINRGDFTGAREILARPVPALAGQIVSADGAVMIDPALANGLNAGLAASLVDSVAQSTRLTSAERAAMIDAQALQLGATADRLEGKPAAALSPLTEARSRIGAIREGRVISAARLEAQLLSEMALAHEALGENGQAENLLRESLSLIELRYPDGAAVSAAQARLAAFLARHGQTSQSLALYRTIVEATQADKAALVGLENQLAPYFDMLIAEAAQRPEAIDDLFAASQLIERPGAAQTLAQLSRRLAAGDGEASALFQRENAVRRELNRIDLALAQARAGPADAAAIGELQARRDRLSASQLELLSALSAYPAYRAVARDYLSAAEMRALLGPGEAYLMLSEVGDAMYAVYLSSGRSAAWQVGGSSAEATALVRALRESIAVAVGGLTATYPFDVDTARDLFTLIMGPVAGDIAGVKHLIFAPAGAMLELPVNLLVAEQAGVDAYHRRVAAGADEFDFRGLEWLGRGRAISTALSAASFRDARRAPPSKADARYLGLGENEPVGPASETALVRGGVTSTEPGCEVPLAAWNRPIAADELVYASGQLGGERSALLTRAAFTDTAVAARDDLDRYKVIHFATHGLVTPPKPSCPIRPALLTSFGGPGSDGLLQFGEIFDLKLDADLVILSACNTASLAGLEATQAAGVEGGGGQALDGLVRAFIGAGGRQVIASHWPAPDEFDATKLLFQRFFAAQQAGASGTGDALLAAQITLMDRAETSHPFYWAGFALVGDGERTLFAGR